MPSGGPNSDKQTIAVVLGKDQIRRMDYLMERDRSTRSVVVRTLVERGLEAVGLPREAAKAAS